MHPKQVMFGGLILAAGTIVSLTFAGAWLGTEEVELQNAISVFKQANIMGVWSVTVPNITFFLVGARAVMMLDFAFFGGIMALLQWVLILVFSFGFMWGIFTVAIGVIQGLFRRATGG